jgi:hypothetical protein
MSDDELIKTHKKNGGGVPDKILLSKKAFVRSCDSLTSLPTIYHLKI